MQRMRIIVAVLLGGLVASAENWVANPGFEQLDEKGGAADWRWWTREEGAGRVEVTADERHEGERAVRIVHEGEKDFNLANSRRRTVTPGESFKITCRMKRTGDANAGTLNIVGLKGKEVVDWSIGRTRAPRGEGWVLCQGWVVVPEGVDTVYARVVGSGKSDFWVDDVSTIPDTPPMPVKGAKVEGWMTNRPVEIMGRGVMAVETEEGVYISWRLLEGDVPDIAFDVYEVRQGDERKLNDQPITQTTDFLDTAGKLTMDNGKLTIDFKASIVNYQLSIVNCQFTDSSTGFASQVTRVLPLDGRKTPYVRIPLASATATAQKIAVADLDGDGVYDYIIKQPGGNVDPWHVYWHRSPETFKLEARKLDGTLLWIKDLGWNIERGMWYSPMLACDLDGNGRAEVALKIGPDEDMRDEEGKVQKGPEWLAILDGRTGEEITRAPWPSRDAFDSYNAASRNQLAVAYLDGKTPCLLALRGTYDVMLVDAWQFRNGKLSKLWSYSNEFLPSPYQGQGAHSCICADVDGDGRDEVILGSVVLDDDGTPLWTSGRGHPDAVYYGDIDPRRPGMEMAYIMETRQKEGGGIHLLDPATGKLLWQLKEPTAHVHSCGMCSDIDPASPGLEIYGAESEGHKPTSDRWLFACDGTLLKPNTEMDFRFGRPSAWWDADLQREIINGKAIKHEGGAVSEPIEGTVLLVADLFGDWREEIITTLPGEIRIYTTPIPAMDRRVCLMQDPLYRSRTMMNAMGYMQVPLLSYVPEALSPNLNLTIMGDGKGDTCRVVVAAPLDKAVKGMLTLTAPEGVTLAETGFAIDLPPGERIVLPVAFTGKPEKRGDRIRAALMLADGTTLHGAVPMGL